MARLTKAESEKRKADIAALLAKDVPWAEIVEELGCSFQTVAMVKNGSGNRSKSKARAPASDGQEPGIQKEIADLKAKLRFLNDFFKDNLDYLFKSKGIQEFVLNHPEFDEVEKLCQA